MRFPIIFIAILLGNSSVLYSQTLKYEEVTNNIMGLRHTDTDFGDLNGDGYSDIILAGQTQADTFGILIYLNDGSGNFVQSAGHEFDTIAAGRQSVNISDMDGDLDYDIVIFGEDKNGSDRAVMYLNDGTGTFTLYPLQIHGVTGLSNPTSIIVDLNKDNSPDIVAGGNLFTSQNGRTYLNNGTGTTFTSDFNLHGLYEVIFEAFDFNGDTEIDILQSGIAADNNAYTRITYGVGDGHFDYASVNDALITPFYSASAVADVDGDNDLDIFISGGSDFAGSSNSAVLYINDGAGNFTPDAGNIFSGIRNGDAIFFDYDADGDADLLHSGIVDVSDNPLFYIYENDGNGNFTLINNNWFPSLKYGTIDTVDITGDTEPEIFISGEDSLGNYLSKFYKKGPCFEEKITISACEEYQFNGQTLTASGIYEAIFASSYDCDSLVILDLTILEPTVGADVISACDSYTWIDGNTYTENNNSATHTLTNAAGCDSVITLNLTISQPDSTIDIISACESYMWIDGNTYIENNNTATYTLTNMFGCDSIVTLNLIINTSTTGTDIVNDLNSYTWIDGVTYTESNNTATHTLTNSTGCDSILTLNLTITKTYSISGNVNPYKNLQYDSVLIALFHSNDTINSIRSTVSYEGDFFFDLLLENTYYIQAIPDASSNMLPTYYGDQNFANKSYPVYLYGNVSHIEIKLLPEIETLQSDTTTGYVLYPNPVDDIMYINLENITDIQKIQIFSDAGILVENYTCTANYTNRFVLNTSALIKGYYIVVLQSFSTTKAFPFIKK